MTINKFNYEVYALDYLEGNLSVEMTKQMERFLRTNPVIEAELSGMMEMVLLEPDTSISYSQKADLMKPEKVIFLKRKWLRPMIAAASIALLLGTFYIGFQAGTNKVDTVAIKEGNNNSIIENGENYNKEVVTNIPVNAGKKSSDKSDIINVEKQVENPIVKLEISEQSTPIIEEEKTKLNAAIIKPMPPFIAKNPPNELYKNGLDINPQFIESEVVINKSNLKELAEIGRLNLPVVAFLNVKNNVVKSIDDSLNGLNNALTSDLQIDKSLWVNNQKRKRNIKDFLGRFPISNLKEAIIPSYYKEETAGQ